MSVSISTLEVEVLNSSHTPIINSFTCGTPELDDFIKNDALYEQERRLNRTYLFLDQNELIGYISLTADVTNKMFIEMTDGVQKANSCRSCYKSFPCVLIGRLAVQTECQSKGIGEFIVERAIGIVLENVSKYIGVRYIVVDPKNEKSRDFYKNKCKFINMIVVKPDDIPHRMYLNLDKICGETPRKTI